jgi:hypothetical protein
VPSALYLYFMDPVWILACAVSPVSALHGSLIDLCLCRKLCICVACMNTRERTKVSSGIIINMGFFDM